MSIHNFYPGPSVLPKAVLERAHAEWLDFQGTGISVAEISHRSDVFQAFVAQTTDRFKSLLRVPTGYHVLWLTGGARMQYAMLPMNFHQNQTMCFLETGYWSRMAMEEAKRFGKTHCVASTGELFQSIPDRGIWDLPSADQVAYLHVVDNETIHGVEYPATFALPGYRLVSDMTSNILSRPFDVSQYAMLYASTQKNMGPSGLTVVVIREDWMEAIDQHVPTILNYQTHRDQGSLYNTPPTVVWFLVGLTLDWLEAQGGVEAIAKQNDLKAKKLYDYIDASDLYRNEVQVEARSRMNVIFHLPNESLTKEFLAFAASHDMVGLKGHGRFGGVRASIYNAMPMDSVDALLAVMDVFAKDHA